MTLAEKHYRAWHKIKPETKLTNEQWHVITMMHECLRKYNQPKLPHGTMLVNRKHLVEHLNMIQKFLTSLDKVMCEKGISEDNRGRNVAKCWNALNTSQHSIKYFEMDIPLERLNEIIK